MATRRNPYFAGNFANPEMETLARGLGGIASMFAQQQGLAPQDQALVDQRMASAGASQAQAGKYAAETSGIQAKNAAMASAPGMLAELFLNGGQFTDDPLVMNPDYQPPSAAPTDYSLTFDAMNQPPAGASISSMFMPTQTARDKMGAALQEFVIRGGKMDDFAKILGQAAYLSRVMGEDPTSGQPFMPLFGQTPTTNTALTTERQDEMSARDAEEAYTQALAVARQQGDNSARVASINQAGQDRRQASRLQWNLDNPKATRAASGSTREPTPLAVKAREMRDIKAAILGEAQNRGMPGIDDAALNALATEAATRFQTNRNMGSSVLSVLDELEAGSFAGIGAAEVPKKGLWNEFVGNTEKKITRTPGATAPKPATNMQNSKGRAAGEDPNLKAARDAIARGAPRDAVIRRLRENGIDPTGL